MAKPPKDEPESEAPVPIEGEGVDGLDGEGGKKSKKKLIIMIVIGLVILLAAGGAGLYFTGTLDKILGKAPVEGAAETGEHIDAAKAKDDCKDKPKKAEGGGHGKKEESSGGGCGEAVFLEIPNMLVNLSGPDDQPRYLRLKVQLEMGNDADLAAVKAVLPRVVDQFQTYLRELRIKDLRGSAGIYRLQMELLSRVNAAAYPTEVKDVLFQEILIQ
ncbi:MAG: flagellar basal body-associated FliL family protein [Micavibrio sp.]|nr:flagellar basal body-associated FliL family protein [Micavibrio sp.]